MQVELVLAPWRGELGARIGSENGSAASVVTGFGRRSYLMLVNLIRRMSEMGHKRKSSVDLGMSAVGGRADAIGTKADIRPKRQLFP